MENDFRIKKINAKEVVEFHNKGNQRDLDTVGGDNWNKFILTLDAKKFKTELTSLLRATTVKMNLKYCKPLPQLLRKMKNKG